MRLGLCVPIGLLVLLLLLLMMMMMMLSALPALFGCRQTSHDV